MTFLFIYGGLIALLMLSLLVITFIIKFDEEHNASYNSWHYKSKRLTTLYKEKETSLIILRFKSWKDKNCPIINWK